MREKIFNVLNKIYGVILLISFFAGIIPLIPFIIAIIIGGDIGEKISLFLYNQYYPFIIAIAAISVVVGLIAMYIGKFYGFSMKKKKDNSKEKEENKAKAPIETVETEGSDSEGV